MLNILINLKRVTIILSKLSIMGMEDETSREKKRFRIATKNE